jgi:SOS-response transcriptional repressor LexA
MTIRRRRADLPPTIKQQTVHAYLVAYYTQHGYPPSQRQMAADLGINRKRAQDLLEELREKGMARKDGRKYIPVASLPVAASADPLRDKLRSLMDSTKITVTNYPVSPDLADLARVVKKARRAFRLRDQS